MADRKKSTRPVETERLDAFVDAAFAFAVSLLIIAGADPLNGVEDLFGALGRIPAFAASFALVVMFWLAHRTYGRLAPVRDGASVLLSLIIVFTVLIYVFPLRLLTESGAGWMSGGRLPGKHLLDSLTDLRDAYALYGAGFAFLSLLYVGLFHHALRQPDSTGLAVSDRREAAQGRRIWLVAALAGLVSGVLAWGVPMRLAPWAPGFAYWLIPIGLGLLGLLDRIRGRAPSGSPASRRT